MSHFFNYDPKLLKKIIYKSKKKIYHILHNQIKKTRHKHRHKICY